MKVAVSAVAPSLEAAVDPRFGRCSSFVVVETDDMSFEAVDNCNSALGGEPASSPRGSWHRRE